MMVTYVRFISVGYKVIKHLLSHVLFSFADITVLKNPGLIARCSSFVFLYCLV